MTTPKVTYEYITPDIAKSFLKMANSKNRKIYAATVDRYARDMKANMAFIQ